MKLVIASDIHGSAYYCNKLMAVIEKEAPDRVVLVGDILYHGPRNDLPREYDPKKVISMLNGIADKIICVKGNCDTEVDGMVLDFDVLSERAVIYDGKTEMFFTHGHKCGPDNPPKLKKGSYLICGHTHVPVIEDRGEFIYVNCGSVSIPKNESKNCALIYEEGSFKYVTLGE